MTGTPVFMERTDFEQWKAKEVARLLALVETERRYYQEMMASLPVALVVLSSERSIVSVNRAFRQTFGLRTEDLRRKNIEQIIPSDILVERIREVHVNVAAPPDLYLDVDGRKLRIALIPIRNWDDEDELETLLMIEDLAPIGNMLAAMGRSKTPEPTPEPLPVIAEPEPAAIDDAIPAILWRADPDTFAFTSVSGAAEQLFGYPVAHWTETANFFSERIHPEDRESAMAFYRAAISRPGDASAEFRVVTASGGVFWCRETIRVPDQDATSREITGVSTDIGLRKQLEEQLLTAERRGALFTLSSRLAHDLNNPLMIITGYSEEMLQSLDDSSPMRGDLQQILGATERISGITGQLLAFTRRLANPPQRIELGPLFASMEEKLAKAAGDDVTLELAAAGEAVWASADPSQLEEILLALVSSAREDAQERSRVNIAWELAAIAESLSEATLKPGVYAGIVIHDNGRGADPAKRATIFESVLAGKDPEKTAGPSLARAYAMVREWGGDIAFTSDPFRGSTFMMYLPYTPPEIAAEEIEIAEEQVEAPTVSEPVVEVPPIRETILLVEDEAGIRALVRKILAREHYNVIAAGSGEDALALAKSHDGPIHLLVTDVILPGIGGRDLAEGLHHAQPGLRVLYVSGYTDDEAVRQGWFPPGSKFLQKPFTLTSLITGVRSAIDEQ
jgi:PAS domain S-box-containing protein